MGAAQLSFLFLAAIAGLYAADFSVQTVDGLGRPLPGVQVEIACTAHDQEIVTFHLQSAEDGMVHGTYDAALCTPSGVGVEKQGYVSYSSGFRARYVLIRRFRPDELLRVIKLDGENRRQGLRELLAGDVSVEESRLRDLVFHYEAGLRPALRSLARDPKVIERAIDLLSIIGVSEDLHLILQLAPPPPSLGRLVNWRYALTTALVGADNEEEWAFLRACASNEYDDGWAEAGAVQTLKLTGSLRSRMILEAASRKNQARASRIAAALDYVRSNPEPLAGTDLITLGERVAKAISLITWKGNDAPRFNEVGDKALVDFIFQTRMDRLVYTATFHKVEGSWVLRGVRETLQAFMPAPAGPVIPTR
jgi:hypothetical protein